jgi:hypothetical protein
MKKRIILSVIISIIGFIIIIIFSYKVFFIDSFKNSNGSLNLTYVGQIGDFIGGFTGTIFSIVGIILLFETLSLQRIESSESKDVFIKQQFDNTFFELLKLHKENLQSFKTFDIYGEEKIGREFFIHQKEFLQNIFTPQTSISKNRKLAIEAYESIYANFEDSFSIYFKTLYQLYSFIEKSKIKGTEQASYSKILRAQLSSAELFFIRYNAMTETGKQSAHYVNLFNILKHLSHFELLEFKDWWSKLDKFERNGLGTVFKEIKYVLKEFLIDKKTNTIEKRFMNNKYILSVNSSNKYEFSMEIKIDRNKTHNNLSIVQGLDKFNNNEIENLFKCILKEFIIYSNFNLFNNRRELNFDYDISNPDSIIVSIRNWMELPIKIHYWYD